MLGKLARVLVMFLKGTGVPFQNFGISNVLLTLVMPFVALCLLYPTGWWVDLFGWWVDLQCLRVSLVAWRVGSRPLGLYVLLAARLAAGGGGLVLLVLLVSSSSPSEHPFPSLPNPFPFSFDILFGKAFFSRSGFPVACSGLAMFSGPLPPTFRGLKRFSKGLLSRAWAWVSGACLGHSGVFSLLLFSPPASWRGF